VFGPLKNYPVAPPMALHVGNVSCFSNTEIPLEFSPRSFVSKDFEFEACHGCGSEICQKNARQIKR
jgi:hypothetical protein